jgi:hypothetical protein
MRSGQSGSKRPGEVAGNERQSLIAENMAGSDGSSPYPSFT